MSTPLSQRLRDAAASLASERVCIATLMQAHGGAAHGSLLLLLAVPCLLPIPGNGTLLGLGILALSVSMWRGRPEAALPRRVAEFEMSLTAARRVLNLLAQVYEWAARVTRARLALLLAPGTHRWHAAGVASMGVVLVLPIPFGNVLPALALILIGLGLVFRDGVALALGAFTSAATVAVTLGVTVWAAQWGLAAVGRV